jgi:hypothetical protein
MENTKLKNGVFFLHSKNALSFIGIFLVLWLLFLFYLFFDLSNAVTFWILALSCAVVLLLQIHYFNNKKEYRIIYLELILLFFALRLIPIMYAGMNNISGLDIYFELASTKNIIETGRWDPTFGAGGVTLYPSVHLVATFLQKITTVGLECIAQWIGVLSYVSILIFYFLIANMLFKNDKVTLLSSLGFVFTLPYVVNSAFGRNPLAMLLFFMLIYLLLKRCYTPNLRYSGILAIFLTSLIFAHHLTRFLLVIFLVSLFIMYKATYRWQRMTYLTEVELVKEAPLQTLKPRIITFTLLAIIGILAYFVYLHEAQMESLLKILVMTLFGGEEPLTFAVTSPHLPLHSIIYYYGLMVVGLVFALIVFINKKANRNFFALFFIAFSGLIFVLSYISQSMHVPFSFYRASLFTWPFALMAVSYAIVNSKPKKLLSLLIILFIVLNLAGYYPFMYDKSIEPDYSHGEFRICLTEQEKVATEQFDVEGKVVGDHYIAMAFLYPKNKPVSWDIQFFLEDYAKLSRYSWFYFRQEDKERIFIRGEGFAKVSDDLYSKYEDTSQLLKVYNNGEVEIYRISNLSQKKCLSNS